MECFNIFKVLLWFILSQQYLKLEAWKLNSWPQSGFGFFSSDYSAEIISNVLFSLLIF